MNVEVHSKVTDVCLYRNGARVTRTGNVEQGDKDIVIKGLPLTLDDDSIQVETSEGCICKSHNIYLEPHDPDSNQKKINRIKRKISSFEKHLSSIKAQIQALQKTLPVQPGNKQSVEFEKIAEASLMLSEFKEIEIANLTNSKNLITERISELKVKIEKIEKNKPKKNSCSKTAQLKLKVNADKAAVKLHYLIPNASWCPSYMVDVNNTITEGTFTLKALACQNSGEDWTNVNMTLSTALPWEFKQLPELKSLYVGKKQAEHARSTWKPAPEDTEELFSDHDAVRGLKSPKTKKKINRSNKKPRNNRNKKNPPRLIILSEIARGKSFELTYTPLTIGRSENNDICISDGTLSGLHALIYEEDGQIMIRDENSCNGTRINGQRIYQQGRKLLSSDIIQVGGIEILYDCEEPSHKSYNTTQTCISLEDSSLSELDIDLSADYTFKAKKSIGFSSMANINPCRASQNSYESPTIETIDVLSENVYKLSSLAMEITKVGQRGKLVWKDKKDLYRRNLLLKGYSNNDFEKIYKNIYNTDSFINEIPGEIPIPSNMQFDFSITTETKVTVPSSKHHHIIPVSRKICELQPRYISVPRESEAFYRVADFENPFPFDLMRGPVNIFMDKDFLCNGQLDTTVEAGKIRLCLGEEAGIRLVRNTEYKEDLSGMLNGKSTLHHFITNQVVSTLPYPVQIQIMERLPLAVDGYEKNIKVNLTDISPAWKSMPNIDEDQYLKNIFYWSDEISPQEEKKFIFKYDIVISSREEIVGGNRREFA